MNADLKTPMRPQKPFAARLAPLPPDGQLRVLQFGPSMGVRGGISSVVQLILDFLPQYVPVRHIPTTEEGSAITKASVFARAVQELRRAVETRTPMIAHIHMASRGSTLRKVILAEMV